MTKKKDLTSIHDLAEFEHTSDPEIEAQFADEFSSKTTVTSLDDLDDEANISETSIDGNSSEDFSNFGNNNFNEDIEESDVDTINSYDDPAEESLSDRYEEPTDPAVSVSEDIEESDDGENFQADFEEDSEENFDGTDLSYDSDSQGIEGIEGIKGIEDEYLDNSPDFSSTEPTEHNEHSEHNDESVLNEHENSTFLSAKLDDDQINEQVDRELEFDDSGEEFPAISQNETFIDQMSNPIPPVDTFQSGYLDSDFNQLQTTNIAGSIGEKDLVDINSKHMSSLSEGMSENIPEITRIMTTYEDFKKNIESLSYAPSPQATGPLFAIIIKGNLIRYKDHIQSILDEYLIDINLNEETYLMPLQSGLIQISRISEYILIQLTNSLKKYGLTIEAFYLEDIIAPENIEEIESKGLESEHLIPQNITDQAEFAKFNDWDDDDVLITTTSGPRGYKVLKRCGISQKMITLARQDYENLHININEFFNDDIHLSGSSTLMDGLIEKIHKELKEDAKAQGANSMVNFKLEQTLDLDFVVLQFSADLLYMRKLNEK